MKKLLDQLGGWPRVLMIVSIVVVAVSLQPLLGTDGWAGLGQWAGGLGALFAAWAALRIAKGEARRENDREADRLRVQAYYVYAEMTSEAVPNGWQVRVTNASQQPILGVMVTGLQRSTTTGVQVMVCKQDGQSPAVLLPGQPWETWVTSKHNAITDEFVRLWSGADPIILFRDLAQTHWNRTGRFPPTHRR
ncbi:hypothetical protein [Amycolatopsis vastitatis]|uniref:Uncharacterized protein n=1 Tax=Amycolatopsis vastitatis TaxID=1905142 RepID=A0A229SK36_9PSEU|nr:hypothetical protein [Amycolatopsis vastitatis]OXM59129.1 hypothetical protein CF165_49275 [Amycolatopsis vastitatis]